MAKKKRLDQLLAQIYPQFSKTQLQSWIMQGKATVDGIIETKAGAAVAESAVVVLTVEQPKFVSRAGFKLEKALDHFGIDVRGLVVLDAGLSTGGFTDCLLQKGAKKVYGIDVGYGQAHEKIRSDSRVLVMERTNLRELKTVGEEVDLVTLDLSFISVLKVMPAVLHILKSNGQLLILIKPQFEARKEDVGRGGIIKDAAIHHEVINKVTQAIQSLGFALIGVIDSPITGTMGNKEFLAYFKRL